MQVEMIEYQLNTKNKGQRVQGERMLANQWVFLPLPWCTIISKWQDQCTSNKCWDNNILEKPSKDGILSALWEIKQMKCVLDTKYANAFFLNQFFVP